MRRRGLDPTRAWTRRSCSSTSPLTSDRPRPEALPRTVQAAIGWGKKRRRGGKQVRRDCPSPWSRTSRPPAAGPCRGQPDGHAAPPSLNLTAGCRAGCQHLGKPRGVARDPDLRGGHLDDQLQAACSRTIRGPRPQYDHDVGRSSRSRRNLDLAPPYPETSRRSSTSRVSGGFGRSSCAGPVDRR